jgi:hypothetical protein
MNLAATGQQLIDIYWRALWTFVEASSGPCWVSHSWTSTQVSGLAALVAGLGSVLSLIKTFASQRLATPSA